MKSLSEILEMCLGTVEFGHLDGPITDVNQKGGSGDTPLHLAAQWGDLEAVKTLVAAGANIQATGDANQNPLFFAIMGGNIAVVKFLLEKGCSLDHRDENGKTALDFARSLHRVNALHTPEVISILEAEGTVKLLNQEHKNP